MAVLLKAKQSGILQTVEPVIDRLEQLGFRLGSQTRRDFLKLAEEG
jgi:predicted nucleic acid-binding protein